MDDLESVNQSEISQKEKQPLYIKTYMWNLEKWYWWTYLQGRDRDTYIENGHVDPRLGREGMTWEISIGMCVYVRVCECVCMYGYARTCVYMYVCMYTCSIGMQWEPAV